MEANLAIPMVDEFCRVDDSFQALARRFAANVEKPGTGSLALLLDSDGVHMFFSISVVCLGKSSFPRGSMIILDFQIIVAAADATISLRLLSPAFFSTMSLLTLSVRRTLVMVQAADFIEQLILSVSTLVPLSS